MGERCLDFWVASLGRFIFTLFWNWQPHIKSEVPYGPRSPLIFFQIFWTALDLAPSPSKIRAPVAIWKNINFGVGVCVIHGWKGIEERNKLYKRTYALKIISKGQILLWKFFISAFLNIPNPLNMSWLDLPSHIDDERHIKMFVRILYTLWETNK